MTYEIINMSDPYTIEATSLDVALVACLFLGSGQYAFQPLSGDAVEIPLFLFGNCERWCLDHLGAGLKDIVDRVTADKALELADCMDSCLIGKLKDRETYRAGLELIDDPVKRDEWRKRWHEDRLSSLNDIGGRAYAMAAKLRNGMRNPLIPAPQQVFSR